MKPKAQSRNDTDTVDSIQRLENKLNQYQTTVSTDYANKATKRTFLTRFKRFGRKLGPFSQKEDEMLAQNGFHHHLFVAIEEL